MARRTDKKPAPVKPSKYIEEYAEQARKLCKLGAIDSDLAEFFHVSTVTIWNWTVRHPAFHEALKEGKNSFDDLVEMSLAKKARGFTVDTEKILVVDNEVVRVQTKTYYPPDTGAIAFWLKNRRPEKWRDKHEIDVTKQVEHRFTLSIFETEEAKQIEAEPKEVLELTAEKRPERARRRVKD